MQIGESKQFPGTQTPEFHIYSHRGTAFDKRFGGGGTSWSFVYRKGDLSFEFRCSRRGGQEFRDVGPGEATAHQLGPVALLHIIPEGKLAALSDQRKREVLEELVQFIGVVSRHWPKDSNGKGMRLEIDESVDFLQRLSKEKIDRLLSNLAGDVVPVFVVKLWHGPIFGSGEFAIGESARVARVARINQSEEL
ncbi:MAG: hypothetical protein ABL897_02035 [Hyphomicrobium sp.]